LRLGLSDLNEAYVPALKAVFEIPQSLGIIGGRPNHALYFIGYAGKMRKDIATHFTNIECSE